MTWWYRNLEIGRVDHDKNFQVHGQGPLSLLEVAPLSGKYFGDYSCRAENIHGSANHSLELVMAREPTIIQQAVLDRVGSGPGSCTLHNTQSILTYCCRRLIGEVYIHREGPY